MAGIAAFAQIKQYARVCVIEIVPHLVRIRIGRQAIERESLLAGAMEDVEHGLQIFSPPRIIVPESDIKDAAGNPIVSD